MTQDPPRRIRCPLRLRGRTIETGRRTLVVGILNLTPDSFYDGGRHHQGQAALRRAGEMVDEGADWIDLGAESSRPGAQPVSQQDELARLLPVLKALRREFDIPLMVDTYKAEVARAALAEGADLINDISAFRLDPQMPRVMGDSDAGCLLMHMRGQPADMQKIAPSPDILADIDSYFEHALREASAHNIGHDRIILDPGIGFGKTADDNLLILNRLPFLQRFGRPVLVGTSRKSFIGKVLDLPTEERLLGSVASAAAAVMRGAHLVRVHDVAATRQVADILDAVLLERVNER
ncbi:MAG TPA: dihydropteroate synthase [Acidobacteriota bacterium]|nr:dihydropteroate synthase [Acidobacteriota bacterium]